MIIKKLLSIKFLINLLLIFFIVLSNIAQELSIHINQSRIQFLDYNNNLLLHANLFLNKDKYQYETKFCDSAISLTTSIERINNNDIEQLNVDFKDNFFKICLDKKGNVFVNGLEFNSYQLKVIALNRRIFLYNDLLAKMGLFLEADGVFNYSNLKIYKDLYIKTNLKLGKFENLANIFVLTGDLKIDIYNAFINNGTIICKDKLLLNAHNKACKIKLGRLEIYNDTLFKGTKNSKIELIDNTCKLKGNVTGLPNFITIKTSEPKKSVTKKVHYHIGQSHHDYYEQEYQINNSTYIPSFLEINTAEKPLFNVQNALVYGTFQKELPMPKITSSILTQKKAQLENVVYTGDGIQAKKFKEEKNDISLYNALIGQNKLCITDNNKFNISLKNGSSLGSTQGPTNLTLQGNYLSLSTDNSTTFASNEQETLIELKPSVFEQRFSFLKVNQNDSIYIYKHPFDKKVIDAKSFGFIDQFAGNKTQDLLNDQLRVFTSPKIYEELIGLNLFKFTGNPFSNNYSDFEQQFEELIKIGNFYSLIHGKAVKITQIKNPLKIDKVPFDADLAKTLKHIIKNLGGNITARKLYRRINQKLAGKYNFVLTKEQIKKSPYSLIIAYITKEKNETCISLGLHLAAKPLNGTTIFGNDVIIKADKIFGESANIRAKNDIHLITQKNSTFKNCNFESANSVKIESNGKIVLCNPNIRTQNLFLYGKLGNYVGPIYINLENKLEKNIWSVLGVNSKVTKINQQVAQLAKLAVHNIALKTEKDNNLCAIKLEKPLELLVLDAGGNNNITSAKEELKIKQKNISVGLDFCGISLLIDGELKKYLFDLAATDPLIREALRIKNANNLTDAFAQTIYASIETFRALAQISKNNPDLKLLLNRFGIVDSTGRFTPKLVIGLTESNLVYEKTTYKSPVLSAETVIVDGKNLNVQTNFSAKNFVNNSDKSYFKANKEIEKKESVATGLNMSASVNGNVAVNVQYSSASEDNKFYKTNNNNIGKAIMNGTQVYFEGTKNNIDDLSGKLKEIEIKSVQNETNKKNCSYSLGVGPNYGSASCDISKEETKVVKQQSELNIKKMNLKLKLLAITGALLNACQNTHLHADKIEYKNIYDSSKKVHISGTISVSPQDVIPVIGDIGYCIESEKSVNKATVSSNIELTAKNDISKLNRDISKRKEIISKEGKYYRIVAPVVDFQKASQAFEDIKKLFSAEVEINAENVGLVTDQFEELLSQETEQEKILDQQIHQELKEISNDSINQDQQQISNTHLSKKYDIKSVNVDGINFQSQDLVTQDDKVVKINVISKNKELKFNGKLILQDYIFDQKRNQIKIIFKDDDNKIIEIKSDPKTIQECYQLNDNLTKYKLLNPVKNYQISHEESVLDQETTKNLEKVERVCKLASSFLLDLTFLGPAKLAYQAASGQDPVTGDQLSSTGRIINGAFAGMSTFKHIKTCAKSIYQTGKNLFNKSVYKISPKALSSGTNHGITVTEKATQNLTEQVATKSVVNIGTKVANKTEEKIIEHVWDMPIGGKMINGRYYTEHALERMAPKTPEVIKELERRYLARGKDPDKLYQSINPRNIPPSVVEETIKNGIRQPGTNKGTWDYVTKEVRVILNNNGDVVTVFRI